MGSDESRCRGILKVLYDFSQGRFPVRSPDLPPMPPVALAPFRRHGLSGPVRGLGRHVRARAVIVLICRSGKDIRYLLQAQEPVSFDTHLQNFTLPRMAWRAHGAWHGARHTWT